MGMLNLIAWILVSVAGVYAAIGLVFALFFVTRGVTRIDPTAIGGSTGFRILILPGVVAFWPLLMAGATLATAPVLVLLIAIQRASIRDLSLADLLERN